jgi:hypothetical protein
VKVATLLPASQGIATAKPETKTNPAGASGLLPDKRQDKPKTIKTARGEKPKRDGFDSWTNQHRTE